MPSKRNAEDDVGDGKAKLSRHEASSGQVPAATGTASGSADPALTSIIWPTMKEDWADSDATKDCGSKDDDGAHCVFHSCAHFQQRAYRLKGELTHS